MAESSHERLVKLCGGPLLKEGGEVIPESLTGKYIGLYFSAHWCPPCRKFTPILSDVYKVLREAKKEFEIIFVSSDSSAREFTESFETMPWAAIPFDNDEVRMQLKSSFGVSGIPMLVILAPDGSVVNGNARSMVQQDPTGKQFPWESKASGCVLL